MASLYRYLAGSPSSPCRCCGMLFLVLSLLMPKYWRGPALGYSVSYISPTHTSALFLEFGKLAETEGRLYPTGEYTLSSFASFPAWTFRSNGCVLATSADRQTVRDRALRRLIGRRLRALAVDKAFDTTRLEFSLQLVLETETIRFGDRGKPHWLLRAEDWLVIGGRYAQPKSVSEWKRLVHPS
jgi:hypothetical protein